MVTPAEEKRRRRHDENFQKDVLDGLERLRTVLHDVSDQLRLLVETAVAAPEAPRAAKSEEEPSADPRRHWPVLCVAELVGPQVRRGNDGESG